MTFELTQMFRNLQKTQNIQTNQIIDKTLEYSNTEQLSEDLKSLLNKTENEENFYDFEVFFDSINLNENQKQKPIKCHKAILSSRSEYFKSLFRSKMKEYQENKIVLPDVSRNTFETVLEYIYTGKILITLENAVEVLLFSSKYLFEELVPIFSEFIQSNFSFETVVDVLKIAEVMNLEELLDFSYQFIYDNFPSFVTSPFFYELEERHLIKILSSNETIGNEFEIFQSLVDWGKNKTNPKQKNEEMDSEEKKEIANSISNLIHKIRFIEFSDEEKEKSLNTGLIPLEISQALKEIESTKSTNSDENEKNYQLWQEKMKDSMIFSSRNSWDSSIITTTDYKINLRKWIPEKNFFQKMKLGFSTSKDGWESTTWHDKCDNKGPILIVVRTKQGFIMGAYTQVGFQRDRASWSFRYGTVSGNLKDNNAFLFTLKNPSGDLPQKFPVREEHANQALFYSYNWGPDFCDGDLGFKEDLHNGFSWHFGKFYSSPSHLSPNSQESKNYFAGQDGFWEVDELETFFI
ncbi:pep-cterm sorting domain-containing protein [Anaeramoeba ignava]|uniref:Pep-cterm sorting domain-containing protein n=1 Tax=Anaeramoeba ignava TaxID=1746090 RepID=A0A9Q0R8B0_ANAIG|nr:pep-cterm sorting domain-containing protein [Anaeramoeba ignava]